MGVDLTLTEDLKLTAQGTLFPDAPAGGVNTSTVKNTGEKKGTYGTLNITANGKYTYVLDNRLQSVQALNQGEEVFETFNIEVNTRTGVKTEAIKVKIQGQDDVITLRDDVISVTATDTQPVTINVLDNDTDTTGGSKLQLMQDVSMETDFGTLIFKKDGTATYILNNTPNPSIGDRYKKLKLESLAEGEVFYDGYSRAQYRIRNQSINVEDVTSEQQKNVGYFYRVVKDGKFPFSKEVQELNDLSSIPSWAYTPNNYKTGLKEERLGEARLKIMVRGVNDAPESSDDLINAVSDNSVIFTGNILSNDFDIDNNDVISLQTFGSFKGKYGILDLAKNGDYIYRADQNNPSIQNMQADSAVLTEVFDYTIKDKLGLSSSSQIKINISGLNRKTLIEDEVTAVVGKLQFSSSSTAAIEKTYDGTYGRLKVKSDGGYTYQTSYSNKSKSALQALSEAQIVREELEIVVNENGTEKKQKIDFYITGKNDKITQSEINIGSIRTSLVNELKVNIFDKTTNASVSPFVKTGIREKLDPDANDTLLVINPRTVSGTYGDFTLSEDGKLLYKVKNYKDAFPGKSGDKATNRNDYATFNIADGHATQKVTFKVALMESYNFGKAVDDVNNITADAKKPIHGNVLLNEKMNIYGDKVFPVLLKKPILNELPPWSKGFDWSPLFNAVADLDVPSAEDLEKYFGKEYLESNLIDDPVAHYKILNKPLDNKNPEVVRFIKGKYGMLKLNGSGNYSYSINKKNAASVLTEGESATDNFNYLLRPIFARTLFGASDRYSKDWKDFYSEAKLTITIQGVNDAPEAIKDTATVIEDTVLTATGNVLANDSDVDNGDVITVQNAGEIQGAYGTLTLAADGHYTYKLNNSSNAVQSLAQDQKVVDSFDYTIADKAGATATSKLNITVVGKNDAPVATEDRAYVEEDKFLTAHGNVLANDTDIDQGDVLKVQNAGTFNGVYGTFTVTEDGSYTYKLNNDSDVVQKLGFSSYGQDTFSYSVLDNHGAVSQTSLIVTVGGASDFKVTPDVDKVVEDTKLVATGNVIGNDVYLDAPNTNPPLNIRQPRTVKGEYGTLTLAKDGSYSYTLDNSSTKVQSLAQGEVVSEVFAYGVYVSYDQKLFYYPTSPAITPPSIQNRESTLTINIHGTNDAPVAVTDTNTASEDKVLKATGNVLANDSDIDNGDVLKVQNPGTYTGTYGMLVVTADGSYTYTLNNSSDAVQSLAQDQQAQDVFDYTVVDKAGATAQAKLNITVTGQNDAPIVLKPISDFTIRAKKNFTLDLPDNTFSDIDQNDVLAYTATLKDGSPLPSWMTFTEKGLVFTGRPNACAADKKLEITVTATDLHGATASDTFAVNIESHIGIHVCGTWFCDDLVGTDRDDVLDGSCGSDTMTGGDGDDTYYVDKAKSWFCAGDTVIEKANEGYDTIKSWVSYTLPEHVEALKLQKFAVGGYGNNLDNWLVGSNMNNTLTGEAGNDLIIAGCGADTLLGGDGIDIIEGQKGWDSLYGGNGTDALFGGCNIDKLYAQQGKALLAGGTGNDRIYTGSENTIVSFNKNDGFDCLHVGNTPAITLSLGGGLKYEDMRVRKVGKDLYFDFKHSPLCNDSIRIVDYYCLAKKPKITLQMFTEASGAYAPTSTDTLRDNKVETFDGNKIIADFEAQTKNNWWASWNGKWSAMNSMLGAHLSGSNTHALGGDLAYLYGTSGLAGMAQVTANGILGDSNFAENAQKINQPQPKFCEVVPALAGANC